jgi:hypothetical protein
MRRRWLRAMLRTMACSGLALAVAACGGSGFEPDGGPDADGQADGGTATYVKPAGDASVTFFVDDTANRTYQGGELRWKGAFVHDAETNVAVYDADWASREELFPWLYDDGPIASGGHEMPGAAAGDHIFSTEIYLQADPAAATLLRYGAVDLDGRWIWSGPLGEVSLPASSSARLDAPGLFLGAFGPFDLRVTLDTRVVEPGTPPFDPAVDQVVFRGAPSGWLSLELHDDGQAGDEVAGDGLYTYLHSAHLGPHSGLLPGGQHLAFVLLVNGRAVQRASTVPASVSAASDCGGGWANAPLFPEPDHLGLGWNLAAALCEGAGSLPLTAVVPAEGLGAGGERVAIFGQGFQPGALVAFGGRLASEVSYVDERQLNVRTPASPWGSVDLRVSNPDGAFGRAQAIFRFGAGPAPEIAGVIPEVGPPAGGTLVELEGRGFRAGAQVTFGGLAASEIEVVSGTSLRCRTPAHAPGAVELWLQNPDGGQASPSAGYEYGDRPGPYLRRLVPAEGSTAGGTRVRLLGGGFAPGARVTFDDLEATEVQVLGEGLAECLSPAHAAGEVAVKVENPDLLQDELPAAFTYAPPRVPFAALEGPRALGADLDQPVRPFRGRASLPGAAAGACPAELRAELGWGPEGSSPEDEPLAWSWLGADCCPECGGQAGEAWASGSPAPAAAGTYAVALRFSLDAGETWVLADGGLGSLDGFQPAQAGRLVRTAPEAPLALFGLEPEVGGFPGGEALALLGRGFVAGTQVQLGGLTAEVRGLEPDRLELLTPRLPLGRAALRVSLPGGESAELPAAFGALQRGAPRIDGWLSLDGLDWSPEHLVAEAAAGGPWGSHGLQRLLLAYDADFLYLGLEGWVDAEAGTCMLVYLDVDGGFATGIADARTLTDETGIEGLPGIDAAISSRCRVSVPGFGADFALASQGLAGVALDEQAPELLARAGLRGLADPAALAWLPAKVVAGAAAPGQGALEAAVPWSSLGDLTACTRLGLFARIVDASGAYVLGPGLPADSLEHPDEVGAVAWVEVCPP